MFATILIGFAVLIFLLFMLFMVIPLSYRGKFVFQNGLTYSFYLGSPLIRVAMKRKEADTYRSIKLLGFKISQKAVKREEDLFLDKTIEKKEGLSSKFPRFGELDRNIFNRRNFAHLMRFFIKIWRQIRPDLFKVSARVNFSDPYHNGLLLSIYYAVLCPLAGKSFDLTVYSGENVLEGDGKLKGKFIPGRLLCTVFGFLFSPDSVKIFFYLVARKTKVPFLSQGSEVRP